MTSTLPKAIEALEQNYQSNLEKLVEFCSIPSISTAPEFDNDIWRAAEWLVDELKDAGLNNVKIYPTGGHPVVYADYLNAGEDMPTALIYGHYDVQPAEPLEKWETPPFEPQVRRDNIYARGATDMKGQILATIAAVRAILSTGAPPINIKFLIEGEEEIGSPHLGKFIDEHQDLLKCDFAINPDTGMLAPDIPTITYALRGLAYFELRLYGPKQDLHSGVYGGVVHNPAQVLCELIAGMHDQDGRITLPGFYDKVIPLSDEERQELAKLPMNEEYYLKQTGAPKLWGEKGYSAVERTGARPTLEVNGLYSGFIGEGSKTVLPAYAMAKISCRLVPEQDPDEVYQQLIEYLKLNAPPTVKWEVTKHAGGNPTLSKRESKWIQAYAKAAEEVWGVRPLFKREGGSVPVVMFFQNILKVDSLNIGFGTPADNMHGPNEKLHLPTWNKGMHALVHFMYNL